MTRPCSTCRHDQKSCKYQNHNDKCNGHQLVSIDVLIKQRDALQILQKDYTELEKIINYFNYGIDA